MAFTNADLVKKLGDATEVDVTAAKPKKIPYDAIGASFQVNDSSTVSTSAAIYLSEALTTEELAIIDHLNQSSTPVDTSLPEAGLQDIQSNIIQAIDPATTLTRRVLHRIPLDDIPAFSAGSMTKARPVMAAPELPHPMYKFLAEISQEFILPGITEMADNTVTLFEPDRTFIEAFLAGLNHEMARELLWREYPTDQRGTYFRQFWNTNDFLPPEDTEVTPRYDIKQMHNWGEQVLGLNQVGAAPTDMLVLAIKGELLEKFPNTIIYAQRAKERPAIGQPPSTGRPDGSQH